MTFKFDSKVQGRLKVCTRGFFFEPQDFTLPILRFFFRDMAQMPIAELYDQANGADCALFLSFETTQVTELKERGVDHPYVTKETAAAAEEEPEDAAAAVSAVSNSNAVPNKYVFALLHSKIEEFLRSVVPIWELAHQKNVLNKVDEEVLLAPVLRPRLTDQFDSSLLVDFRERPLLTAGKLVDRIVPLLKYPGCLMLTNQRYAPLLRVCDLCGSWPHLKHDLTLKLYVTCSADSTFSPHRSTTWATRCSTGRTTRSSTCTSVGTCSSRPGWRFISRTARASSSRSRVGATAMKFTI